MCKQSVLWGEEGGLKYYILSTILSVRDRVLNTKPGEAVGRTCCTTSSINEEEGMR